jgi:putative hemolysin
VDLPQGMPERRQALTALPPLLRLYLGIGGWVSDHAVIDRAMDTLHVFTAVEIAAIPPARQGLLRAVAQP